MNRSFFYLLVVAALIAGISACGEGKRKSSRTDTATSGAISFASDESFSPIIEENREVFEHERPQAHLTPLYMSEGEGMELLMKDSIQLLITARKFHPAELQDFNERQFRPVSIPFAYDGMALIINRGNTDSCITVNDVRRVLSGEVKTWNEINPGSRLGDIEVVFDNKRSSMVRYCVDSVLQGKSFGDNTVAAKTSADVIDYVEKTPNAIGVIGSNWLNDKRDTTNTTWNKKITVMSVSKKDKATEMNSWKPYQVYLLDGRYPFVRTLYALLNDPYHGLPWAFAHFLEMPKGQLIILKSGLLPMRGDITIRDVRVSQ